MKRTMKITLFILLLALCSISQAQVPDIIWEKSFGGSKTDRGHDMCMTNDGTILVSGLTYSYDGDVTGFRGGCDYWVVRIDTDGDIISERTFGGTNYDWLDGLAATDDGGYVLAGDSQSDDIDVPGNKGGYDAWIVKVDKNDSIEWSKNFGGSNNDYAMSIITTNDGGYAFIGNSLSNDGDLPGNYGKKDYWVVKLDKDGNLEWSKNLGGSDNDHGYDILQDKDGNYLLHGYTSSNDGDVVGQMGFSVFWTVKLSSDGNTIMWQRCLGGSDYDNGYRIRELNNGNYLLSGTSRSDDGYVTKLHKLTEMWLVEIDSDGEFVREKTFGGDDSDYYGEVIQTDDNGFLLLGTTRSNNGDVSGNHNDDEFDYWLTKINGDSLNVEWQKCMGGDLRDYGQNIIVDNENYIYVSGYSESTDGDITNNLGSYDFWTVKLSNINSLTEINTIETVGVFPNPVNGISTIRFTTNKSGYVKLSISDITGRLIQHLLNEKVSAGEHNIKFNRRNLQAGIYFYTLETEKHSTTKKLLIN